MTPASQPPEPADEYSGAEPGPGHLLRAARESAGISLRDVSAQMHLDERTMVALESDAFDELPAPTFVRGYLRGYARLLGVPVRPVMEAYDREGFKPPDLVADIAEKPQANSGDFPVRLTTYVVVLVLGMLVVAWWKNQTFDETAPAALTGPDEATPAARRPPAGEPATVASTPVDSPSSSPAAAPAEKDMARTGRNPDPVTAPAAAIAPVAAPMPAPTPPRPATGTPGPGPTASTASPPLATGTGARVEDVLSQAQQVLQRTREELRTSASSAAAPPAGTPASGPSSPSTVTAAAPAAATPAPPAAQAAAPPAPAASVDEGHLRLRFPDEAWVEIYDRNDARLYYNLAKPGAELDLRGPPPLRVLLGRTRGVVVEYNGKPVDLEPHTERGVARFTLDR